MLYAWLLARVPHDLHGHSHGHHHHSAHDHHDHMRRDQNLRGAYLHVLTDALTSVLAIIALLAGKYAGWVWMDPMMGIVGAVVRGLLRDSKPRPPRRRRR